MRDGIAGELATLIARANGVIKPQEGDYKKDGLLYCGKCDTPKQARVELFGKTIITNCLCKCEDERKARELEEFREKERQAELRRMRTNGVQDKSLMEYTFSRATETPLIRTAKRYAEKFDTLRDRGTGLLFWGGVGNGKTYAAACIANELMDQGRHVLLTNFPKLLAELSGMFAEDRNEYINSLMRYSLLVIDDFGTERKTDFGYEQVYSVINSWYTSGIPMVMTTNLTLDEMKRPANVGYARIYDRVLERCVPIRSDGESFRKGKARDNLQWAREILRGDDNA